MGREQRQNRGGTETKGGQKQKELRSNKKPKYEKKEREGEWKGASRDKILKEKVGKRGHEQYQKEVTEQERNKMEEKNQRTKTYI